MCSILEQVRRLMCGAQMRSMDFFSLHRGCSFNLVGVVGWPRERCEEKKHPKADFRGNVDF